MTTPNTDVVGARPGGAVCRRFGIGVIAALLALLGLTPSASAQAPAGSECSGVMLLAVPGSGETDTGAPPDQPRGLLARFTDPLAEAAGSVDVRYIAYPAAIDQAPFYPASQAQGTQALEAAALEEQRRCPDTVLHLIGYSQGGDVVDDALRRAAAGQGTIDAATIGSAVLIGSPRRDPDLAQVLASPGQGLLGPRPTSLGDLADRTYEICAAGDPICSASGPLDLTALRDGLASGAHRCYPNALVGPDQRPLAEVLPAAYARLVSATSGDLPGQEQLLQELP